MNSVSNMTPQEEAAWVEAAKTGRLMEHIDLAPPVAASGPHGVYGTYVNQLCRCSECRTANAAHQRDFQLRRKAAV